MVEINQIYEGFKLISTGDILADRGQMPVEQLHACETDASFIQAFYPNSFRADRLVDYSPMCTAAGTWIATLLMLPFT